MLSALALAATVATLTPNLALQHARAMIEYGVGEGETAQFRRVALKSAGPNLIFCGQVNVRDAYGGLTGWQDVLIVVSGNPGMRAVITARQQFQRDIIRASCEHGTPLDRRDYSAALSVRY